MKGGDNMNKKNFWMTVLVAAVVAIIVFLLMGLISPSVGLSPRFGTADRLLVNAHQCTADDACEMNSACLDGKCIEAWSDDAYVLKARGIEWDEQDYRYEADIEQYIDGNWVIVAGEKTIGDLVQIGDSMFLILNITDRVMDGADTITLEGRNGTFLVEAPEELFLNYENDHPVFIADKY